MKTANDYLEEANSIVPKKTASEAIDMHGDANTIFVDVRDAGSIAETGTIADALRAPRGLIEFLADETSPMHLAGMDKSKTVCVVCAKGGQAALAGKTLKEMGYETVFNIGGIGDWKAAGGPTE